QQKSKLPGFLVALGVAGLVWWWLHRAPPIEPPPTFFPPPPGWSGTWVSGDALIRLRGMRGEYSPDGMTVIPVRARAQGGALTFAATVQGRPMSLTLTRIGESARLIGRQEYQPSRAPVVFAPGGRQGREEQAARRREETRRMLTPVDLGTFRRQ